MTCSLRVTVLMILALAARTAADPSPKAPIAATYREPADRIINSVMAGNDAYNKLTELCDDIGHRIQGSEALDRAIRWAADRLTADGHENVHTESVTVTKWVRGNESATMIDPRHYPLAMLGLGNSVGTIPGGITAPVVVVGDEDELESLGTAARGKIVLFNNPMPAYSIESGTGYGRAVRFRHSGARLAAAHGAVACLVRSVTAHSLRSPHTGGMSYRDATARIPAAAISVEDADMIARFQKRGIPVTVRLEMEARTEGDAPSANVIAELRGSTHPDEIVVIGGHIDTWDVGQGAHDDGAGCIMAMEAVNVLRKLNLRPRRTIRVVLWTGEENGLHGARAYAKDHAHEMDRHVAAIEADIGGFAPLGYSIDCKDEDRLEIAAAQMRNILSLTSRLGANKVTTGWAAADVSPMKPAGVIIMGHESDPEHYFDYHHTDADTIDKINPHQLSQNVAVMAAVAYILADMPQRLGEREPR